jgi:prophage regulatory protein
VSRNSASPTYHHDAPPQSHYNPRRNSTVSPPRSRKVSRALRRAVNVPRLTVILAGLEATYLARACPLPSAWLALPAWRIGEAIALAMGTTPRLLRSWLRLTRAFPPTLTHARYLHLYHLFARGIRVGEIDRYDKPERFLCWGARYGIDFPGFPQFPDQLDRPPAPSDLEPPRDVMFQAGPKVGNRESAEPTQRGKADVRKTRQMAIIEHIPETGLLRTRDFLGVGGIPLSKSSWYEGITQKRFPAPEKHGRSSFWRAEDIHRLIREGW